MMDYNNAVNMYFVLVFYTLTYISVSKEDVILYVPDFYKADQ